MEPNYGNKFHLKSVFLKSFSKLGLIKYACHESNISESTFYRWLNNDEEFQSQYGKACDVAIKNNKANLINVPVHKRAFGIQESFEAEADSL